jgi:hypothetical protein
MEQNCKGNFRGIFENTKKGMKLEYKSFFGILIAWHVLILIFFAIGLTLLPLQQNYLGGSVHFREVPLLWSHANYDGEHYLQIAQFGYGPLRYFFFPLYPVFIRFVSHYLTFLHFPLPWAGILVTLVSFFCGFVTLYKLLLLDFSKRISIQTILLMLFFPVSFYFTAVYTEALFFVLCVSSFYFARQKNWLGAGILGIFASMTRLVGVVLIASLFVEWFIAYRKRKTSAKSLIPVFCIPLGLVFYMLFLQRFMGDPLGFFHNIATYGSQRSDHIILLPQVFYRYIFKIMPNLNWYWPLIATTSLELLSGFVFFVLTIVSFFKIRLSYSLFLFFGYIVPTLSGSFSSMPRYVLVLFPAFLILSIFIDKWPVRIKLLIFSVLAVFLGIFTSMFVVGFWVS